MEEILRVLKPYRDEVTVGVESTYNWYWLLDGLKAAGIACWLGHALYMKRKMSGKHKNDHVDARGIADLLRTGQFPLAYAYPAEMRATRDLLRRRHFFVRRRAGTLTHFQNSLHQDGCIEPLQNKLQYKSTRDGLIKLGSSEDVRRILSVDMDYIKSLDVLIDQLDKSILEKARQHNPTHLAALQTIPGCGKGTALTILYEMHTIERFRTPQRFCSYARVVRADNESAGKNLGGTSNDKIGNAYLKWAFAEIGMAMIRCCTPVRLWCESQARAHGKPQAHARLRHKIALAVYYMLKHGKTFDLKRFVAPSEELGEPIREEQVAREIHTTVESTVISPDCASNPAHNWPHTSGHSCEPRGLIGQACSPGLSSSSTESTTTPRRRKPRNNRTPRSRHTLPKPNTRGRLSLRTTGATQRPDTRRRRQLPGRVHSTR
jgi:transposase